MPLDNSRYNIYYRSANLAREYTMTTIRKSDDRGHFDHGWLSTYHTFSFGEYYDPKQMGFRSLRVINEDRLEPGTGFGDPPAHRHGNSDLCA